MSERVVRLVESALSAPGISWWRQRKFEAGFRAGQYVGICRGIYGSYRDALGAAPATKPTGYDHEGPASMYRDRMDNIYSSDYPMLFWLGKTFADGATNVFDLGGHVGISYYAYQKVLAFPERLTWNVLDMPAVAAQGRDIAATRDSRRSLHFVDRFDGAASADVLFTAGCVQYLEETLAERIATLASKPKWVLVNLLPLHDTRTYWTVQSIGEAFCAYRIEGRSSFFGAMEKLGYETVDRWGNPDKACAIMFERELSIRGYAGAAFRLI